MGEIIRGLLHGTNMVVLGYRPEQRTPVNEQKFLGTRAIAADIYRVGIDMRNSAIKNKPRLEQMEMEEILHAG